MNKKPQFPLITFMQRSENDLKSELNLLQQAKKNTAKLLAQYVEATKFCRQNDMLALEDAYDRLAKILFSGSSEIPPIRISCGLEPIPTEPSLEELSTGAFMAIANDAIAGDTMLFREGDEPINPIVWMEQREIDGVQFLGSGEVLGCLENGSLESTPTDTPTLSFTDDRDLAVEMVRHEP